jgi:hypothetical protein
MRKVILGVIVLFTFALQAHAQVYEYAAKYMCGRGKGDPDNFAPGTYYTTINVHSDKETEFLKRFTVSLIDEKAGGGTKWITTFLPQERSLQIQCRNILTHLADEGVPVPPGEVAEGYVVIQSTVLLDVWGVYSAAGPDWVSTLNLQQIRPKRIQ